MKKRTMFVTLISILAFAGVIGANLANASGPSPEAPAVQQADTDSVEHECPPACNAQDAADEATEGAAESAEAGEAPEGNEAPGAEADGDTHEDVGDQADHECPPECDTANGETT